MHASAAYVARHEAQILEELNVKGVEMLAPDAELVSYRIKPNLPRIGKRYGKRVPAIRDALSAADGSAIAAAVAAGRTFDVDAGGETITFEPEDVLVESTSAEGYACAEEGGYLVGLDTASERVAGARGPRPGARAHRAGCPQAGGSRRVGSNHPAHLRNAGG